MTRYIAFLRGVNLGKRQTKSADLVAAFEGLGFTAVRTLISSGNVLFETDAAKSLQKRIEAALEQHFGFSIGVVLRTLDELKEMIDGRPFARVDHKADVALHVLMLAAPMKAPLPRLVGVEGDYEVARVDPDAIYLVVHRKPDGTYLGRSAAGEIDKLLPKGHLVTMRNWNTIEKAAK